MQRTVAIAGGGFVGRSLAIALKTQSHLDVVLYAGGPMPSDKRSSTISASARRMLSRIGAWPMMAEAAQPVYGLHITDSASEDVVRPEVLNFEGEHGANAFAHLVPNHVMHAALVDRCAQLGIAEDSRKVVFFEDHHGHITAELSDGSKEVADVLVAADGRQSVLRRIAGIPTVEKDFHQSVITGTVSHSEPHNGYATQHFLPNGAMAMLPLVGDQSSLAWSERPSFAKALGDMDAELASLEIERVFGLRLGRLCVEGGLQVYPLKGLLARRWVDGRLVLAGDAAHVIHPLAGQGLNLGFRDVAALAEVLTEADRHGEDLALALPRYERWRRADTTQMAFVTDGLNTLFSRRSDLVRSIRSIGLGLVNRDEDLKALFIREAAGVEGDVPHLMRGEAV
ncbi:MAG: FAD-dependent monooxygenase [Pseudomonadota bacterium]